MNKREFLFDNVQQFFKSAVWQGERFYDAKPYRPWFGWLYVALYEHTTAEEYKNNADVQIKIGQSSDIDRRNKELFSNTGDQNASSIVYAWSVPLCIRFEGDLKTLLAAYIMPEKVKKKSGASEIIIGIPLVPLINIIQLSILKTCLHMRYIRSDMNFIFRPPDTIKYKGNVYPGKRKFMVPHELDVDSIFKQLNIPSSGDTTSIEEYIFLQDKRIVSDIPDTHDKPEIEGDVLMHSEYLTDKVYHMGTYVYAKYTRETSSFELAKIIGYGKKKSQTYAVRWLETIKEGPDKGDPIVVEGGLKLTDDRWEFTSEVRTIFNQNRTIYNKFKEIVGVTAGRKTIVRKLRL